MPSNPLPAVCAVQPICEFTSSSPICETVAVQTVQFVNKSILVIVA